MRKRKTKERVWKRDDGQSNKANKKGDKRPDRETGGCSRSCQPGCGLASSKPVFFRPLCASGIFLQLQLGKRSHGVASQAAAACTALHLHSLEEDGQRLCRRLGLGSCALGFCLALPCQSCGYLPQGKDGARRSVWSRGAGGGGKDVQGARDKAERRDREERSNENRQQHSPQEQERHGEEQREKARWKMREIGREAKEIIKRAKKSKRKRANERHS